MVVKNIEKSIGDISFDEEHIYLITWYISTQLSYLLDSELNPVTDLTQLPTWLLTQLS